jgi:hypothetical protein
MKVVYKQVFNSVCADSAVTICTERAMHETLVMPLAKCTIWGVLISEL